MKTSKMEFYYVFDAIIKRKEGAIGQKLIMDKSRVVQESDKNC